MQYLLLVCSDRGCRSSGWSSLPVVCVCACVMYVGYVDVEGWRKRALLVPLGVDGTCTIDSVNQPLASQYFVLERVQRVST